MRPKVRFLGFCVLAALLLLASQPARAAGDIRLSVMVWMGNMDMTSFYLDFDATLEPTTGAIDVSRVVINGTTEVPIDVSRTTVGTRHVHAKRIFNPDSLGSGFTFEIFARKRAMLPSREPAPPPELLAKGKVNIAPRIAWGSPPNRARVTISREGLFVPPRYPPVTVKWKPSGVTGPYRVEVRSTGPGGAEVYRKPGVLTTGLAIPGSVFESGKEYQIVVSPEAAIPISAFGPYAAGSSFQYGAGTESLLTVVKL